MGCQARDNPICVCRRSYRTAGVARGRSTYVFDIREVPPRNHLWISSLRRGAAPRISLGPFRYGSLEVFVGRRELGRGRRDQ